MKSLITKIEAVMPYRPQHRDAQREELVVSVVTVTAAVFGPTRPASVGERGPAATPPDNGATSTSVLSEETDRQRSRIALAVPREAVNVRITGCRRRASCHETQKPDVKPDLERHSLRVDHLGPRTMPLQHQEAGEAPCPGPPGPTGVGSGPAFVSRA